MLDLLLVSNRQITINDIDILEFVKPFQRTTVKDLTIIEIPEVYFCRVRGRLIVYLKNGTTFKLAFQFINALNVFNLSSSSAFLAYDIFLNSMKGMYRQKSETQFYNKRYNFDISTKGNFSNCIVTIRNHEVSKV